MEVTFFDADIKIVVNGMMGDVQQSPGFPVARRSEVHCSA